MPRGLKKQTRNAFATDINRHGMMIRMTFCIAGLHEHNIQ